jgi:hypothetical protein
VYYVKSDLTLPNVSPSGLRKTPHPVVSAITCAASDFYDGFVFIPLLKAVSQAHSRLFPDEPYKDARTLQAIALAFTELMPIYWQDARTGQRHVLTEPELSAARFTVPAMEVLSVSKVRFEAALDTMQVASLDQARVSLTLRQSPRTGTTGFRR